MEVSTEISQKIRSAIKAKLQELGSYVDDELPDYIMVMVANKKTRSQMNGDLGLFLGVNTIAFTEWLHGLLDKLQSIQTDSEKPVPAKTNKTEKSKSSKEKKKNKEKSQKDKADSGSGDATKSKHSKKSSKDKKKVSVSSTPAGDNVGIVTGGNNPPYVQSESSTNSQNLEQSAISLVTATAVVVDESSTKAKVQNKQDQINEPASAKNIEKDLTSKVENLIKQPIPSQKPQSVTEDVEDVRQLLVTSAAAEDELAEELETTEVEVSAARKVVSVTKPKPSKNISQDVRSVEAKTKTSTARDVSSSKTHLQDSTTTNRKRKTPISVVAAVSRREDFEEEYDPTNPAVGTVASVVKVTTRKSSIPATLQANRVLLLKAMTEAEQSVASKKKMAIAKPISRRDSPIEVYSPKRKRTDRSHGSDSPPPYIPSKKDSSTSISSNSSQNSSTKPLSRNDARHVINRDSNRESTLQRHTSETSNKHKEPTTEIETTKMPEGKKKQKEVAKKEVPSVDKTVREGTGVTNIQITRIISSDSRSDGTRDASRKRRHSSSPEPRHVTFQPASSTSSKSTAERLGKIVVERKTLEDRHDSVSHQVENSVSSSKQVGVRENFIVKVGSLPSDNKSVKKSSNVRTISNSAREAVQKQCEAAVISVQAAKVAHRTKRDATPDRRIVECDTQSPEEKTGERHHTKPEEDAHVKSLPEVLDVSSKEASNGDDDDDDLSKMIDEDLGPELLVDSNNDEFTLGLDIDEDLSQVAGISADDYPGLEAVSQKEGSRTGTRFIVTLDGVDEKHFQSMDISSGNADKFKNPPIGLVPGHTAQVIAPSVDFPPPGKGLYLDLVDAQNRPLGESFLQLQASALVAPSKPTPPKIQPFSISLKDSDDEHDDKEGKQGSAPRLEFYQQEEGDVVALRRAKLERCKFWPACAAGASCEYHHPTAHCKTFPNCKFGDKCLFIHPNCRFDSKCARPDCPFTHTSRRPALTATTTHVIALPKSHFVLSAVPSKPSFLGYPGPQTVCRYFPNCQNANCVFLHPKPCKFSSSCQNTACPFFHPQAPSKDKLKWHASAGLKAEMVAPVKAEPVFEKPVISSSSSNPATVSSTSQLQ